MSTPELMQVIDELDTSDTENYREPVTARERYEAIRKLQALDEAGNSIWSAQ